MPLASDYQSAAYNIVNQIECYMSRRNRDQLVDMTMQILLDRFPHQRDEWITDRVPEMNILRSLDDPNECMTSRQVLFVEPDTGKVTIAVYKEKAGTRLPRGSRPMIWRTVERRVFRHQLEPLRWRELPEVERPQNQSDTTWRIGQIERREPNPCGTGESVTTQPFYYYTYHPPRWDYAREMLPANPVPTPEPEQPRTATGAMLSYTSIW